MNPLSPVSWIWRVWRGRSVTFAVLFAFGLLGFSILAALRQLLRGIGAPWFVWLILPFVVVVLLSRKEAEWMPDPLERRKWALRIILWSIGLSLLVAMFGPKRNVPGPAPVPTAPVPGGGRANPHGI